MTTEHLIREYWERCTPMNFGAEKWPYEKKRSFRYGLQDYMHDSFGFGEWRGKRVLEVGSGSGIDSVEFARNGALVTACDLTRNAVVLTGELAQEAGVNVPCTQLSGCKLPFMDESFDLVYSYGVLHHIPDVDSMLKEIRRVLKPDGRFMGMVYNKDSLLFAYLFATKGKNLARNEANEHYVASQWSERNDGCPYTKVYSKQDALTTFGRYFKDVAVDVRYNVIDTLKERKVKLNVPDSHELGWHLIVKGVK